MCKAVWPEAGGGNRDLEPIKAPTFEGGRPLKICVNETKIGIKPDTRKVLSF